MKSGKHVLKRIPLDSYQIVNNNDNSIDIHFSEQIISELQINTKSKIQIRNEVIDDQDVVVLTCEN